MTVHLVVFSIHLFGAEILPSFLWFSAPLSPITDCSADRCPSIEVLPGIPPPLAIKSTCKLKMSTTIVSLQLDYVRYYVYGDHSMRQWIDLETWLDLRLSRKHPSTFFPKCVERHCFRWLFMLCQNHYSISGQAHQLDESSSVSEPFWVGDLTACRLPHFRSLLIASLCFRRICSVRIVFFSSCAVSISDLVKQIQKEKLTS